MTLRRDLVRLTISKTVGWILDSALFPHDFGLSSVLWAPKGPDAVTVNRFYFRPAER
jgi:hypothetical protein